MVTRPNGDLEANLRSFLRHLRAENKSPKTLKTYESSVRSLQEYLACHGLPTDVGVIRREHLESFIEDQLRHHKPATANNRYRGLQQFWRYLIDEEEVAIEKSPFRNLRPPKIPEYTVPVLTLDQIRAILGTCSGKDFESRRDMALLRVMAVTGARRMEVANLRYAPNDPQSNDVDLDLGVARVHGKGGRDRLVPLDPRTARALDRYLRVRDRHVFAFQEWLWLGKRGHLTSDGIRQMLERRTGQAGLPHITPHQFRHSFAHHFLAEGGNESDLMRIAGWRSAEMVRRYARSSAQERAIIASKRFGLGSKI